MTRLPDTPRTGRPTGALTLLTAAGLLVLAAAGTAQRRLYTVSDGGIAPVLRDLGDRDGDGYDDFAVAAFNRSSSLVVRSGRTARVILEVPNASAGAPQELVDLDGDGVDELIRSPGPYSSGDLTVEPGAPTSRVRRWRTPSGTHQVVDDVDGDLVRDVMVVASRTWPLQVDLHSGVDGRVLGSAVAPSGVAEFGSVMASAGDLDGDGRVDVVIGGRGGASIHSLPDGNLQAQLGPPDLRQEWGIAVAIVGDVDGDGSRDVAVGGPSRSATIQGLVRIHSGSDGATLRTWRGSLGEFFGSAVAAVGDIDGDGLGDLAVGCPQCDVYGHQVSGPGFVRLLSTGSGLELGRVDGPVGGVGFGFELAGIGDVDADGADDVLVLPFFVSPTGLADSVTVVSAREQTATVDRTLIPAAPDAEQRMTFWGAPELAGAHYLVLGSLRGIAPGFSIGGTHVPLQPDGYTAVLASPAPNGVVLGHFGVLDHEGRGRATFRVPSLPGLDPALLEGLALDHAFVVFEPSSLRVLSASTALPLSIVGAAGR